jgi:hypothetical protein
MLVGQGLRADADDAAEQRSALDPREFHPGL